MPQHRRTKTMAGWPIEDVLKGQFRARKALGNEAEINGKTPEEGDGIIFDLDGKTPIAVLPANQFSKCIRDLQLSGNSKGQIYQLPSAKLTHK